MCNFKVGEKVICIAISNRDIDTGEIIEHPEIHEECIIIEVTVKGLEWKDNGWLVLKGYDNDICYEPWNFRKLDYQFAE